MARHLQAIRLCQQTNQSQISDKFRDGLSEAYSVAYSVGQAEAEGGLPVGVNELVCEYVVKSRGLAEWTVHVQRLLRTQLNNLSVCA
eukprot:TRINITY_DN4556_c0_g2_i6.p1 TRINITY_DN4556_c0_g2~~TRINITY_DN4556_c0_g2_i6.p1  ORF type:complete len:100 (-),score=18.19 TRINITY_DN4556_c0_g2_i6:181-441(-)